MSKGPRIEITREQANECLMTAFRMTSLDKCETFEVEQPNGIGATGHMWRLYGYAADGRMIAFTTLYKEPDLGRE